MNIVDFVIIAFLAYNVIRGIYRGFVSSVLHIISFFLTWIGSFLLYERVAAWLNGMFGLSGLFMQYFEVSDQVVLQELAKAPLDSVPAGKIGELIASVHMPDSMYAIVEENVATRAFAPQGLTTFGQYLNQTCINVLINAGSFILVFFILTCVFNLVIAMVNSVAHLPLIRTCDNILGGLLGFIVGVLIIFIMFIIVPVVITILPFDQINTLFDDSMFAPFFMGTNLLNNVLSGIL